MFVLVVHQIKLIAVPAVSRAYIKQKPLQGFWILSCDLDQLVEGLDQGSDETK
jgi:hypothetical protein